ncbi:MAG: hypothetical protein JOZ69_05345, partial [Myxococcales bacterium]|nr:hypothetical protein [Myxococcales bacterium]
VALFAISHHEMWRDELHCWLVARDSATPWDVVRNRAYDGHPPLFYWLLWVLEKTTHDPLSMRVVHVLVALAAVWVFARYAPFPRLARGMFPFGYFLAFEYVAISRCYGMALLIALLLCAGHRRALDRPARTAALLVALALTTTVATLVALAYALVLAIAWARLVRAGDERARLGWLPIAAGGAAVIAAAACAWPPADSTVTQVRWPTALPDDAAQTRLVAGLLPIPKVDFFFWNSNLLLSFEPFAHAWLLASTLLFAWIVFALSRRPAAALLFSAGSLLLVALFAGVYGGDVRHHGFFFVLFLMAAWIAAPVDPHRPPPASGLLTRLRARALEPTLIAILAVHVPAAAVALYYDWRYVFSSGKRAADVLRANGLEDALLVAEIDFPATAVLGQLRSRAFAYSPRTGRPFSFVKWTADRRWDPTDAQTLDYAASLAASRGEDAILLMNRPLLPPLVDGESVVRIAELYDSMIQEENFYIYRVRSARAAGPPALAVRPPLEAAAARQ